MLKAFAYLRNHFQKANCSPNCIKEVVITFKNQTELHKFENQLKSELAYRENEEYSFIQGTLFGIKFRLNV